MRSNTADFFSGSLVSSCREGGASDTRKAVSFSVRAPGKAGLKRNLPVTSQGLRMVYFFRLLSVGRTLQTSPSALSPPAPGKIRTAAFPKAQTWNHSVCDAQHSLSTFSECIPCPCAISGRWLMASGKFTPIFSRTLRCRVWWQEIFI